jgi:hypothetical protein
LVQTEILEKLDEPITYNGFVQHLAYYKLGKRGLQKLCELNKESEEVFEKQLIRIKELEIPNNIELATSIIVNEVFIKAYRSDEWIENGQSEEYILTADRQKMSEVLSEKNLIPTWFYEDENQVIGLIMNPRKVDNEKLKLAFKNTYYRFAAYAKRKGKELHLVFSYIDASLAIIFNRSMDSVSDEVLGLKKQMPFFQSWPDNLHVYVFSANRAIESIYRMITHQESSGADNIANLSVYLQEVNLKNFHLEKYKPDKQLEKYKIKFDELLLLTNQNQKRLVGTIYGREGSVMTFQKINSLIEQLPVYESLYGIPISLWVLYMNKKCQSEEVLDAAKGNTVWLTDIDTWEHRGKYNFRFPNMEKLFNKRILRETNYYPIVDVQDVEDFREVYVPSINLRQEMYYHYRHLTEMKNKWKYNEVLERWLWNPRVENEQKKRLFDAVCEIKPSNRTVQCIMIQENKEEDLIEQVKSSLDLLQKEMLENNNIRFRNFPKNDMQAILIVLPTIRRMYHYHSKINLSNYDFPIVFLEGRLIEDVLASTFNRTIKVVENNELKEIKEENLLQWLTKKLSHIDDDRKP